MESKARMILSITELLIERCKACVGFVRILEGIKEFSMRLGGSLELTEFGSCKIIGNGINVVQRSS